jgi:hypothetical protein
MDAIVTHAGKSDNAGDGYAAFYRQRVNRARSFVQSGIAWSLQYLPGSLSIHWHGSRITVRILWNVMDLDAEVPGDRLWPASFLLP